MRRVSLVLALSLAAVPLVAQPAGARGHVSDSLIVETERALAQGRPWRATRTIAPLLETEITRTPAVVLLAARAAAGWSGWSTVIRLLRGQAWLDEEADGAGRALLARALLEKGEEALEQARLAVLAAALDGDRGDRLVVLARVHDRADRFDSAAAAYTRAAVHRPLIADWLRLRAAAVTADTASRASLLALVRSPAARARTRWADAAARERTGDRAGAIRVYDQLGARLSVFRLRLAGARDAGARLLIRRELVALLPRLGAAEVRDAIALIDRYPEPLATRDEHIVARRAAAIGLLERAARGFAWAARTITLADGDRVTYGSVLARLGRHRDAIAQFDRVRDRSRLAEARYYRARSLFRVATEAQARTALRRVRDSFPGDSVWAATAGWLIADAAVDDGEDSAAWREFGTVSRRFPTTSHGDRSAFQAALLDLVAGRAAEAARAFEAIADRRPGEGESTAGFYWAGRAWEAAGDTTRARARWRDLLARFPASYYVVPAARRLGVSPWPAAPAAAPAAPDSGTLATLAQAALLDSLGLSAEAEYEHDRLAREATTAGALVAAAVALRDGGHPSRAMRLAQRALDRGAPADATLLRLLYPLSARDVLEDEARRLNLPPLLVAGLIRQESGFDPGARSRADARGLMQVLPNVGAQYARRERLPEWDPVLLYQPDVNLHFGLLHFAERREACGGLLESALAAYNAGPTPVNRWLTRGGTSDPEILIERIPYVETRDYVRRVMYNWARYEALYGSGAAP